MEFVETADSLKYKLGCKDDSELGAIFGRTGGAVSVWRKRGLPPAIEKRAKEIMAERGITPESEPDKPYTDDPLLNEGIKLMKGLSRAQLARLIASLLDETEEET